MSRRLLQRGRYPKAPAVEQISNTNSQFPQNPPIQTSQMSFYDPNAQTQTGQNSWAQPSYPPPNTYQPNQVTHQPPYPNPNTYQQNQVPHQPMPDSSGYWAGGQMLPVSAQSQWNESWYQPENTSDKNSFPNYQQPETVTSSADQWQQQQQVPYSQIDNQNYPQQQVTYNQGNQQEFSHPTHYQSTNNNSQAESLHASLPAWENGSLEVSQPEHLPWTYGAPQYSNPVPAAMHDFSQNSNSATNTMPWPSDSNYASSNNSNFTAHDASSSHYLLTNTENVTVISSENKSPNHSPTLEQNITSEDELHSSKVLNDVSNLEDGDTLQEQSTDLEYAPSTLSAFFQNNVPDESGEGSDNISTPVLKDSGESSQEERESPVLEDSVNKLSDSNSSLKEQGDNEDENNFLQEEKIINLDVEEEINKSQSPGFIEEPVNQEVPDPRQDDASKVLQSHAKQNYDEISTEEPQNQEIPAKSGQTSRSTSSERERLILRPREDSPFKPPRPNSSKGMIVQQEISEQNHPETKYNVPEGKTVVQEVNLETFPDNLERPSDYEELKKQSPLYTSRKHLRSELNSSPSSLLCDNLDIPCVTLAPAAPPLSSARSDKSESSTESKSEMLSFTKSNLSILKLNEPNKSSSSSDVKESNIYEKSKSKHTPLKESSSLQQSRDKDASISQHKQYENNFTQPPKEEKTPVEKNDFYNKPIYLKDSKINGSSVTSKDSQPARQPPTNAEYPESNLPPSRSARRDTNYPPDERNDPRYGRDRQEGDRHRFYEQKYPSFDERQCYSDRERSRPSSRNSLRDRSEEYPYPPRADDYYQSRRDDPRQYPPEYERPSSRLSETDASRNDRQGHSGYYRQQYAYPPGGYPRNDYYQRPPAHRGYEYDHYPRDPYYSSYYDAYRYAYSNYNYGFYDELYRNDPRYKQYQEQYRQYYAKHGYDVDFERSSVHSGRSSANEFGKDPNSSHYREPDIDSNESEFSSYNLEQKYYGDSQNEMSNIEDQISTPSSRLTPVKFSYAHPIARFSPGGLLITGIPCQASTMPAMPIRIQTMQALREDEESFQELKNHQGPLIRGLTHKNDVIEFCNQKIKSIKSLEDIVDRDSYMLLWELMVLLLRQNGSVAGSDIAELLLRDHEILRPSLPLKPAVDTPQGEHSPADVNDSSSQSHAGDASSPDEGIVVLSDKTVLNTSQTVDVDKLTRKFREFLLFGHKKDALEWAMKHGLWGHALFLASKMDVRTYANVMTRFANSLALNDPLQTLYQLMSGRQPLAVTNVADKRWGDWRPHLAMILSNPSGQPDVDSRSITTLGDTLASKGCLCAAHFCYIMAQVDFGTYEQKNSKLVLLTADHSLPFEEFASNEAIQLTEIYEYAQSLANSNYMLVHLQLYKFLYALRLVEHGFLEEALHYCEIISTKVQEHPHLFQLDFLSEVYKLATQLKYHDPHFLRGQGEFEDQEDPDWIKNLTALVQNFNNFSFGDQQLQQQQMYIEQPTTEIDSNQNTNNLQFPSPTSENVPFQNVPTNNIQNETTNAYNHVNYYQNTNWNQQNNVQNATFSSNNSPLDSGGYYQGETATNQNSFYRQNSIPSHEENETTDVPSSPVTQTSPFDYFSSGAQQEWSSVHSLPSVSLSDACSKSDLEALVHKEETESDVALCSSSHSTPLHNYLLSKDSMDDRRMLMTRSDVVDARTLNSCLKSSRSHNSKHKKCIKFDASVSQGKLQKTGIRRRRFSKKKSETIDHSDSSLEGSPSKEKHKGHHKLSLLQSLGFVKSNDSSTKTSKRKRKAKKKNETIEKLLQSKKTFAIDEPCDMNEEQWAQKEKTMDESVQETKKIISILKKLSDEEKKNSQLSQLMANELNKKPPLIFGGTYPIDEPFESAGMKASKKRSKVLCEDDFSDNLTSDTKANMSSRKSKHTVQSSGAGYYKNEVKNSKRIEQFSREKLAKMSPIALFKRKHKLDTNAKDDSSNTSWTTTASSSRESSNKIENERNANENKHIYESSNTFNKTSHRERRDSAMSSGSRYSSGSISVANKSTAKETQKQETKKDKSTTQAGKTWLGGIFSRLLPKGPNQMILPDDKNPTIVWDENKQCWRNTDSNDDDETNAPLAPPTDMELMGSKSSMNTFQTPGSSAPPSSSAAPPGNTVPPPSSTSMPVNKFSRPKTRGMRQNYVDILNTSGSTKKASALPESLFPSPYESTSSPKLFIPDGTSSAPANNSADLEPSHTPYNPPQVETQEPVEMQTTPLMFDPAEYDNRKSSFNNQRPTLGRTGRRTYPT